MDLLASMNLEELPEQQTRTVELMERYPDFDFKLGFDACCTCGKALDVVDDSGTSTADVITCPSCRRVKYCSEACRIQDATVSTTTLLVAEEVQQHPDDSEEEGRPPTTDQALGHSAIVCALLSLCDDDEAVETQEYHNKIRDCKRLEAAQDRVRSEDESYPATLANVLAEGPCYQAVLDQCRARRRNNHNYTHHQSHKKLVLHVIGASIDSELWGCDLDDHHHDDDDDVPCFSAYAEALAELNIDNVELVFIGPECPSKDYERHCCMKRIDASSSFNNGDGNLVVRTYQGNYTRDLLQSKNLMEDSNKPDVVIFFNPGFTVPEYDWRDTLASIDPGTPFLLTTNTELEGIADCQYLLDQDKIQSLPAGLADIFGVYSAVDGHDDDEDDQLASSTNTSTSFFNVNPFSGNRVRQSGTMANDLYIKNRWILGGILDSFDPSHAKAQQAMGSSKKQRVIVQGSGGGNQKINNPALI